jgi:hypothetical protein
VSESYVLDASALVAFLTTRSGTQRLGRLFKDAGPSSPLLVSAVNWGNSSMFHGSGMVSNPPEKHWQIFCGFTSESFPWMFLWFSRQVN